MRISLVIKLIVLAQLIIISVMGINIYHKKNTIVNKEVSVSPIDKFTVQQIETNNLKYFYEIGVNQVATWSATFLEKPVIMKYNEDGLNDVKNYMAKKESRTFRIITLGDSYTFGAYVNTKDNWTELLESKLNEKLKCRNIDKFEVINLGVGGYDLAYEVERYKRIGMKYDPDLIIWTLVELGRINELRSPVYEECINHRENGATNEDCWNYAINKVVKKYGMNYIINKQREAVNELRKVYDKPIFFVDYYGKHGKIVKNVSKSINFDKILTKEYLLKNYSYKEIHFIDSHPNELGHKLITDILFDQLLKTNQIQCEAL